MSRKRGERAHQSHAARDHYGAILAGCCRSDCVAMERTRRIVSAYSGPLSIAAAAARGAGLSGLRIFSHRGGWRASQRARDWPGRELPGRQTVLVTGPPASSAGRLVAQPDRSGVIRSLRWCAIPPSRCVGAADYLITSLEQIPADGKIDAM